MNCSFTGVDLVGKMSKKGLLGIKLCDDGKSFLNIHMSWVGLRPKGVYNENIEVL